LTADYERSNFSVSQAVWNDTAPANIKTITSPSSSNVSVKSSGLGAGAIAGIVVGVVLLLIFAAAVVFFLWRRKRQSSKNTVELDAEGEKNNAAFPSEGGIPADDKKHASTELDALDVSRHELSGIPQSPMEMEGGSNAVAELASSARVHELYGDDLSRYSELRSES
jgi:hypothetical protein